MKLPTYAAVHNYRNKVNKNGCYLIHIRVTLNRKQKFHEVIVPLKVRNEEWSGKEKIWVKNNHPYAFEINNSIEEKLKLLTELNKRYFTSKKQLTFPLIFKELEQNYNRNIFNEYYALVIKDPPEALEDMGRYKSALSALNSFNAIIPFFELSEELFQNVKKHLQTKQKLVGSTINGYFNAYKKVVYWARLQGHISKDHEESIFEGVKIKIGKPKKDHLEIEEILEWINYQFPEKYMVYERDRDMFQLLIYTAYYYSDLKSLLKKELKKDFEYGYYLYSDRYKNDNLAIVPLWKFPKAMPLILKYMDKNPDNPYLLRRDAFIEDQVFNRNLKVIAGPKMLNWKRNIKNKLGRNTNSQLYIRFGAERPIVSRMMGHEKEETTSAYYDVNIRDVIEGIKNVDFERLGI